MPTDRFIYTYVLIALFFGAVATAIIMLIMSKKTALDNDPTFIEKWAEKQKQFLKESNSNIKFQHYIAVSVIAPIVGFLLGIVLAKDIVAAAILLVLGLLLPSVTVRIIGKRNQGKFEEEYSRALKLLVADLRSGMSIGQAVEEITTNPFVKDNIKNGFKQINSDLKTGIPVNQAFQRFAETYETKDTKDVAAAISMQSEVGGSEAKIIELISENIRSRIMFRKEMKSVFADTELMATVMDVMPFALIALLYFTARDLIQPFFESTFMTLVFVGIMAFTLVGTVVIRKQLKKAKGGQI